MALHQFNSSDSKVSVNFYRLSKNEEKSSYESLINDSTITVIREEFVYDRSGKPTITLWWLKEG